MTKGRRVLALLLLIAALALAALGQYYFFRRSDYVWDGVVLYGLAVLSFVLAWRMVTVRPKATHPDRSGTVERKSWLRSHAGVAVPMVLGLVFSLTATLLARQRIWNQSSTDVIILWLFGIAAALVAAFAPVTHAREAAKDWKARLRRIRRGTWFEVAIVAGFTILALTLRVAALGSVPYTVGGDEAWHGLLARQVLEGELRNPFVMGYMSMPTFFYWPLSWSLWLVNNGVVGLRLPAALVGAATVPILYCFARPLWGRRIAVLSALFLAAYDYHIHYSRLGANNVWDPLFTLVTLWLVELGLRATSEARRTRFFILSGIVLGLSAYFYTGARLLPLLMAAYVAFFWVKHRFWGGKKEAVGLLWPLLMLVLAFLIAAGPILSYALLHPDEWNARLNQVGIVQSGWLAREPGLTGKSTLRILADQFLMSAGAFHVYPDRTVWYGADRPLLGFLAGIFAALGMAWALLRWRERRYFLVLLWFWAVIISGGMLTESPPSSQRLVLATPAVALLVAIGLEQTVALLRRLLRPKYANRANVVLGLLILVLMISSVRYYFGEFTAARRYGSANGETATMMGHYLADLDGDYQAYFFGAPRIYWSFGTMAFLAPKVSAQDIIEPLQEPPGFVDPGRGAVFLLLPERAGELTWIQQAFPGGTLDEQRDASGQVRFIAYRLP